MKLFEKLAIYLLAAVLFTAALAGCAEAPSPDPTNELSGSWKDVYHLTEYEFGAQNRLRMKTINFASFDGSYMVEDEKITITLSVLGQEQQHTYDYRMEGDRMFLNKTEFVKQL